MQNVSFKLVFQELKVFVMKINNGASTVDTQDQSLNDGVYRQPYGVDFSNSAINPVINPAINSGAETIARRFASEVDVVVFDDRPQVAKLRAQVVPFKALYNVERRERYFPRSGVQRFQINPRHHAPEAICKGYL